MKPEVNGNGAVRRLHVEPVRSEHVFEAKEVDVRAESHLAHAIRVEVELVLDDLSEVLNKRLEDHIHHFGRNSVLKKSEQKSSSLPRVTSRQLTAK
jgi:hypothetical protein